MASVRKFIEDELGLTINEKKSKVCGATASTFLGFHLQNLRKVGCRPSKASKSRFKDKLKKLTSRKRQEPSKKLSIESIEQQSAGLIIMELQI